MSRPAALSPDVVEAVRERLARGPGELTPHRVAEALRDAGRPVGDAEVLAVHDALRRDVLGAGPLEPLLRLPGVTDVLVNGPDAVYVDRGAGLERTDVRFPDDAAVRRLAQRLAGLGGRRLDDAVPHVDVRLADGSRLHAVLAPVARPGTVISLRVPHARAFTLEELVDAGTLTRETARLVGAVVEARLAFLVSGGTPPVTKPGMSWRGPPHLPQPRPAHLPQRLSGSKEAVSGSGAGVVDLWRLAAYCESQVSETMKVRESRWPSTLLWHSICGRPVASSWSSGPPSTTTSRNLTQCWGSPGRVRPAPLRRPQTPRPRRVAPPRR